MRWGRGLAVAILFAVAAPALGQDPDGATPPPEAGADWRATYEALSAFDRLTSKTFLPGTTDPRQLERVAAKVLRLLEEELRVAQDDLRVLEPQLARARRALSQAPTISSVSHAPAARVTRAGAVLVLITCMLRRLHDMSRGVGTLLMLLLGSFSQGLTAFGSFTTAKYVAAYTDPFLLEVTFNTVVFVLGSSLFSTALAVFLAYLNTRTNMPMKGVFTVLSIVPMMIPHLLFSVSWALLLNPSNGMLNLVLKNLVENSIKHGLEPRTDGGTVWILANAQDNKLSVTVADDGQGLGSSTSGGTGIGLRNVRERLRPVVRHAVREAEPLQDRGHDVAGDRIVFDQENRFLHYAPFGIA